jgi:hypothetical protein
MNEYLIKYFILNNNKSKAYKYISNGILFLLIGSLITSSSLNLLLHEIIPFLIFITGVTSLFLGAANTIKGIIGIYIKQNKKG